MTLAPLDSLGLVASLVVLDLCVGRPLLSRQVEEHDAHNDLEGYNDAFFRMPLQTSWTNDWMVERIRLHAPGCGVARVLCLEEETHRRIRNGCVKRRSKTDGAQAGSQQGSVMGEKRFLCGRTHRDKGDYALEVESSGM